VAAAPTTPSASAAEAPRRPASLPANAAAVLATVGAAMTDMQKQRGEAGTAVNSGGGGQRIPAAAGKPSAGGGG